MRVFSKKKFTIFIVLNFFLVQFAFAENVFEPVQINERQQIVDIKDNNTEEKRFTPKKCFLDIDTHMSNIMAPNTDNVGFAVGMLNPVNFVVTVVLSPVILLFWPLKSLR